METDTIVQRFFVDHNLAWPSSATRELDCLNWLLASKAAFEANLHQDRKRLYASPTAGWYYVLDVLSRVIEQSENAFITYFAESWGAIEVIARAVLEGAISSLYILEVDSDVRISRYMGAYFASEKRALDKYLALAKEEDPDTAEQIRAASSKAAEVLDCRRELIEEMLTVDGLPQLEATGWPRNVIDRFKAVERLGDYRGAYHIFSSQAHFDASDVVDYMILKRVAVNCDDLSSVAKSEVGLKNQLTLAYSQCMCLAAIEKYSVRYDLFDAARDVKNFRELSAGRAESIRHELEQERPRSLTQSGGAPNSADRGDG
jgi:hypothetical protein